MHIAQERQDATPSRRMRDHRIREIAASFFQRAGIESVRGRILSPRYSSLQDARGREARLGELLPARRASSFELAAIATAFGWRVTKKATKEPINAEIKSIDAAHKPDAATISQPESPSDEYMINPPATHNKIKGRASCG
jgi:hypothetical protein